MELNASRDWSDVLGALPLPVAILDTDYRFVLLNRASKADPLLARSHVGDTDLGDFEGDPAAFAQALERHRQYERSLTTKEPFVFEEDVSTAQGKQHMQWLCVPVRIAEKAQLVVVGICTALTCIDQEELEVVLPLLRKIDRELRAPLTAMVGLTGMLAHELSGEQQARASLIDQSGQQVLRHLSLLIEEAGQSTRDQPLLRRDSDDKRRS